MARLRRHVMVAVLLDFEGAFNAVWHNGLRKKLRDCQHLNKSTVRWLSSFLEGRFFVIRVGSFFSTMTGIGSGVPQGSALSPILFAFFTEDLLADNNSDETKAFVGSYADDVLVYALACFTGLAKRRAQIALDKVGKWSRLWRLPLSPTKCQVMRFGGGKNDDCRLYVSNTALPIVKKAMYLGVNFDTKGTWQPHFDLIVERANKRLAGLRCLCRPGSPVSMASRKLVYLAAIRPLLEYCCAAFLDASYSQKSRLIVIQNNALRAILGVSPFDHMDEAELCRRSGILKLEDRWVDSAAAFGDRALCFVPTVGRLIMESRSRFGTVSTPLGKFQHKLPFGPFVGGRGDL